MQGFNMGRYVPPEYEGIQTGNKLAGKNALGNRARKAGQGILTVRFEMPFAIWCTNCPKETIIGQGVRFNAEKKKVGNYYSTPIWSFRMKHTECSGWIEIRTDPQNTAYVVENGGRKRDTGEDKFLEGDIDVRSPEERERLKQDAFAALEKTIEHRGPVEIDKARINELLEARDRDWDDTYAANQRLRKSFRVERKIREENEERTIALQDKLSLGIDLLDETDEDRRKAALVHFGEEDESILLHKVRARSIFDTVAQTSRKLTVKPSTATKQTKAESSKRVLHEDIARNTRSVVDPFLSSKPDAKSIHIPGLKRKRDVSQAEHSISPKSKQDEERGIHRQSVGLVNYGDDSDLEDV